MFVNIGMMCLKVTRSEYRIINAKFLKMLYPEQRLKIVILAYTLALLSGTISCLKIVGVNVPELADVREPVSLTCTYDTGQDALFSVKWYKGDHEFYRYMPSYKPTVLTFPLSGAKLEMSPDGNEKCGLTQCTIQLKQLTTTASGAYTCEVSTEAPTFRTVIETKNMTVAAFPLEEPRIEGLRTAYTIGDLLDITCKSAPSAPPAHLKIFLNNQEVGQTEISQTEVPVEDDLSSSLARLKMVLSKEHFQRGGSNGAVLRVVCSAAQTAVSAPERSSAAMTILADEHQLKNFQWSNSTGKCVVSILLVFTIASIQIIIKTISF